METRNTKKIIRKYERYERTRNREKEKYNGEREYKKKDGTLTQKPNPNWNPQR
jgi:hypothetical protein